MMGGGGVICCRILRDLACSLSLVWLVDTERLAGVR